MLGEIRGEVRFKEPLSFHTSLRIGGPADIFVVPQDVEDIRLALGFAEREQLPVEIVGGGNNLLVRDRGIRGVVLKLEGCLGRADFHGEEAVAGAGVGLSALIREAAALNLGGIEPLRGQCHVDRPAHLALRLGLGGFHPRQGGRPRLGGGFSEGGACERQGQQADGHRDEPCGAHGFPSTPRDTVRSVRGR